jgi:hypothetical protein
MPRTSAPAPAPAPALSSSLWQIAAYLLAVELLQLLLVLCTSTVESCFTHGQFIDLSAMRCVVHLNVTCAYYVYGMCMHLFELEENVACIDCAESALLVHQN